MVVGELMGESMMRRLRTLAVGAMSCLLLLGGFAVVAAPSAEAAPAELYLDASLRGPDRLPTGSTTEVEVVVRSTGTAPVTNAVLKLTKGGTTLVSYVVEAGPPLTCTGSPVVCSLGTLSPGAEVMVAFTFQLPTSPGLFSFVPTVEADNAIETLFEYYPRVIGGGVDLWLTMPSGTSMDRLNPNFSLPARIANVNYDAVASSTLTLTLPTGAGYRGYSVSTGSATCSSSSNTVTCTTGALGGRASGTNAVEIVLDLTAPSSVGCTAVYGVVSSAGRRARAQGLRNRRPTGTTRLGSPCPCSR